MTAFINTVSSNLRDLRARLREYDLGERGITILKELAQNADDAGATRLEFVLLDAGDPDTDNSLLHGPGLLVFNDGPFRKEHEQNFSRPAGTSKSQDATAVGRFGIGLKSIFHLCEAWFWLGRSKEEGELHGVIDPWAVPVTDIDHERPDWNAVTERDLEVLRAAARAMKGGDSWLLQWLPLRIDSHRREQGGLILDQIWSVDALLSDLSDLSPLAELLPQLGGLRSVNLLRSPGPGSDLVEVAGVTVEKPSQSLGRPGKDAPEGHWEKEGRVKGYGPGGEWALRYWLGEVVVNAPELDELYAHSSWPRVPDEGNDVGRPIFVKDKMLRHGAVTILHAPAAEGARPIWPSEGFGLGWAAFLPLGVLHHTELTEACGSWAVRLHGAFFPDHGRRHPLGFAEPGPGIPDVLPRLHLDGGTLRADLKDPRPPNRRHGPLDDWFRMAWNRRLAEVATIPQLLPTLCRALGTVRSLEQAEEIVRAFTARPLAQEAREAITRHGQLVVRVRSSAQGVELIPKNQRVVALPRVDRGGAAWRALTKDALARLEALPEPPAVTWSDAPGVRVSSAFDDFTEEELGALLGRETIRALGTSGSATGWVAELLDELARTDPAKATRWATQLLRGALAELGNSALRNASTRDYWQRITAHVPAVRRFETGAWRALELIDQSASAVLILPVECRPSEQHPGAPGQYWPGGEWRSALLALHAAVEGSQLSEETLRDVGQLAADIMREIGLRVVLSDPSIRDRRLFTARSSRHGPRVLVSAVALQGALTFQARGMHNPNLTADRLFRVIEGDEHDVLLVSDAALASTLNIPLLSEERLLKCFLGDDALSAVEDRARRAEFLESVLTSTALATLQDATAPLRHPIRRGVRYLLAGDTRADISESELLVRDSHLPISDRAVEGVLELSRDGWRVLDDDLLGNITQPWRRALGIRSLTTQAMLDRLGDQPPEALEELCSSLTEDDLDGLLVLSAEDEAIWMSLPAQRTTCGRRVSANQAGVVRSRSGHTPASVLAGHLQTIQLSENPRVAADQKRRVREWSPAEAVRLALHIVDRDESTSAELAIALVDSLVALKNNERGPFEEALRTTLWLPRLNGEGVAPSDLLNLPDALAGLARRLLHGQEDCFVLPAELDQQLQQHSGFEAVLELGSVSVTQALSGLAMRLESLPPAELRPYLVGPDATELPHPTLATRLKDVLSQDTGWALLLAAYELMGDEEATEYPLDMVEALTGSFDAERCVSLLQLLQRHITEAEDETNDARMFHQHLTGWLHQKGALAGIQTSVLRRVLLPNAAGTWSPTTRLTAINNAREDFRLDSAWADALGIRGGSATAEGASTTIADRDPAAELSETRERLEHYFSGWHTRVPLAALGLFIALLGDGEDDAVKELAQSWLGALSNVQNVRDEAMMDATQILSNASPIAFRNTIQGQIAVAVLHEGTVVQTSNLFGEPLDVPVGGNATLESLVIGGLDCTADPQWLLLTEMDASTRAPADLLRLLRDASHQIHRQLTGHRAGSRLDALWDRLEAGGQVQVEVMRRLIRRELPSQLRLMGLAGSNPVARRLSAEVKAYRDHEQAIIQLDIADRDDPGRAKHRVHLRNKAREEAQRALDRLEEMIEQEAAHRFLLGRVRARLRDEQYDVDRVPFELFQNADDAVAQLEAMREADGHGLPEAARSFEIELAGEALLRFWHWGRGINRHYIGPGFTTGRQLGYDQDLLHMMLLHASDKAEQERTTGRFGLGFKSVHLVSDGVRVQSEQLAFAVRAGFLPTPEDLNPAWLERRAERLEPTVVELPLTVSRDAVLKTFIKSANLLPVFAQAIDAVRLVRADGSMVEHLWHPEHLVIDEPSEDGTEVLYGDLALEGLRTRLLVVRGHNPAGPDEAFAIPVKAGALSELPLGLPTIWCTAPTSQSWGTGWCLNGPFQVDVGRSQLGRTEHHIQHNKEVATSVGSRVAGALSLIDQLMRDRWQEVAAALHLPTAQDHDQTRVSFWLSAWARLSHGVTSELRDAEDRQVLEAFGRGWFRAFTRERRLPTGLTGRWAGLTTIPDVRWVADDALARADISESVSAWPWVEGTYKQGTIIHPRIREVVSRFRAGWRLNNLTLAGLIKAAWADGKPLAVERLSALRPLYDWLNDLDSPLPQSAHDEIRQALQRVRLRSDGKATQTAGKLVLPELSEKVRGRLRELGGKRARDDLELVRDEHLLAAFAPPDWLVEDAVTASPEALLIYLEARRDVSGVEAKDIASWAREASDDTTRRAVVAYLAEGKRARELGKQLAGDLPDWAPSLETLSFSGLLSGLTENQKAQVLALLFPRELLARSTPQTTTRSTTVALHEVYDWWMTQRHQYLDEVHRSSWPEAWHDMDLLSEALDSEDLDADAVDAWMTLLLLGALRSLGRATPAHHVGFIQNLKERGAWEVFLTNPREQPDTWTAALREWEDRARSQPAFQRWWMFFPVAHQLRGHLDIYVRLLRRIGRSDWRERSLRDRVQPRVTDVYSQAGRMFDAPFLPAGIGLHWIARELCRLGLDGLPGTAAPVAWVPDAELRRIFFSLGVSVGQDVDHEAAARRMHGFIVQKELPDPTFAASFGLPLRIVYRSPVLLEELGLTAPDEDTSEFIPDATPDDWEDQ